MEIRYQISQNKQKSHKESIQAITPSYKQTEIHNSTKEKLETSKFLTDHHYS